MNPQSLSELMSGLLHLAGELLNRDANERSSRATPSVTTPFTTITQSDWAEAVRLWNAHGRNLLADLPSRSCPVCGDGGHRYLFNSYDGYSYVECNECGCWFVPFMVEASLFDRFFLLCPQARDVAERSFAKRESLDNIKIDMERIGGNLDVLLPLLPAAGGKRYLDMGCGVGHSLKAAQDRGMEGLGFESSNECIAVGKQSGLDIRHVSAMPSTGQFHLISFWESLEHMADPLTVLRRCVPLLDELGLVAFTVPNQHSPLVRAQRGDCSFVNGGYDTAGHINLFSPSNIGGLLERSGLVLLSLDGQYGLNLAELVSYMMGNNRGAEDMLKGTPIDSELSDAASTIIGSVGPAVTLLEHITLTTPILFGFACRKESVRHFDEVIRRYHAERTAKLQEEIKAMMPTSELAAARAQLKEARGRLAASEQQIAVLQRDLEIVRNPLKRIAHRFRRKQER